MIKSIGQVMLYVNDIEGAKDFWVNKIGFNLIEENKNEYYVSYTIAPLSDSSVQFVLYEKEFVSKNSPKVNLGNPSILMSTNDLEETRNEFIAKGVKVSPISKMDDLVHFSFSDEEGHYFAVREVKQ